MHQTNFSMSDDESIDEVYDSNVKVFVRILPLEKSCDSCAKISTDGKTIYVRCLQDIQRDKQSRHPIYWAFHIDGIFHEMSQDKVYCTTAKDLVKKALDGVNCVLIGYGQTGSGKSFTIGGLRNNWEHRGIVSRLLSDMFMEKANRRKISDIRYRLSFIELRGKNVIDLLTQKRRIFNVNERSVFKNVIIVDVENEKETLKKVLEGEGRRSIVRSTIYPVSHLGAAVITIHVSNASLIKSQAIVATAKIHIVEMAGTGTVGKSSCRKTAADLGMANLMKMQLEQYFLHLRKSSMCTYSVIRSSNLLKLLRDAFTVTSIIRFISHVRITREDLRVTLSTMRLTAKIAKLKPIKTIRHIQPRIELIVQRLQEQVNTLKKELELNDMFLHQEALSNISKSRLEQISRDVINFLQGSIPELILFNVTQARVLVNVVKQLYDKLLAKEVETENLKEAYNNVIMLSQPDAALSSSSLI
ncbi:kinesin-like protein KIF9 isoform X1 [Mycetomoellerius zeteki]|uniref:kinesin-like protein KIF9 isoform X1 n=1 Tax=Mycetomoellerius zeteki TaxID=64791 RepID=UPI00084E6C86|nr:PREDICTED: kinesin-like protein KIF9 isoform X1 [Trachymyrmex zeteki]